MLMVYSDTPLKYAVVHSVIELLHIVFAPHAHPHGPLSCLAYPLQIQLSMCVVTALPSDYNISGQCSVNLEPLIPNPETTRTC